MSRIFITGSTDGLGLMAAELLVKDGHQVTLHARNQARAADVRTRLPGADAVVTGDMIHSPLQARYPELGMRADYDSKQAGVSRRELFSRVCDTSTLMCMAHFPSPSTGRITRWGDGFKMVDA